MQDLHTARMIEGVNFAAEHRFIHGIIDSGWSRSNRRAPECVGWSAAPDNVPFEMIVFPGDVRGQSPAADPARFRKS